MCDSQVTENTCMWQLMQATEVETHELANESESKQVCVCARWGGEYVCGWELH